LLLWELLFLVALAVVRGLHLLRIAGALLGHFDLGQVALAAAHIVAALADITGNADVFHIYHLSVHSMACGQGVYSGKLSQPFSLRASDPSSSGYPAWDGASCCLIFFYGPAALQRGAPHGAKMQSLP
jgi:hypothetical protein